jgi:predicted DNA-binding protein
MEYYKMNDKEVITLPIKLKTDVKQRFKESAKSAGFTMQDVATALIESYIESPGNYQINKVKIEVVNAQDA